MRASCAPLAGLHGPTEEAGGAGGMCGRLGALAGCVLSASCEILGRGFDDR